MVERSVRFRPWAQTKPNKMKLTNLQRAIIAGCSLLLLLGACALIAKAEFGRALVVALPAFVGVWVVSNDKNQIKL
jgi:hypothetical protein